MDTSAFPPKVTSTNIKDLFHFTTLLRITSGQEPEPEFILVEHSYARPWNWQSESSHSQPRKTLFLSKIPKVLSDELIDVEKHFPSSNAVSYDLVKGMHLMSECERHVVFAKLNRYGPSGFADEDKDSENEELDWEEKVNKTGWTETQCDLFSKIVKILDLDRLAKLALQNTVNEPIKRRAQIDKSAAAFRQTLGRINWDVKLSQWLHNTLLQHMCTPYLAAYLDILQTLKSKIPNLVDKMIALSNVHKGPNIEALDLLLKRPWDPAVPVLSQQKPSKLEMLPIFIQVPSGTISTNVTQSSRRFRFFSSQLHHLAKCIPVSVTFESSKPSSILEQIMFEVQSKVAECRVQYPSHPVVLLGWGVGAVLACMVSLIEKVAANVCLGFPMVDHKGKRGDADDPLLDMRTPTLFVVGDKAANASVDDLEDFRYRMTADTSLVVISGADMLLRMSVEKRYWDCVTQSMVDRCIMDEIAEYLARTLNEETKDPSLPTSLASSVATPTTLSHCAHATTVKKETLRKRRLSPVSFNDSPLQNSPPKMIRTSCGTAISQNLGLKIPVGAAAVASLSKSEGKMTPLIQQAEKECSSAETDTPAIAQNFKVTYRSMNDQHYKPKSSPSTRKVNPSSTAGVTLPMATISLGSLASLSRRKYQHINQISESSTDKSLGVAFGKGRSAARVKSGNDKAAEEDSELSPDVDIFGLSSVEAALKGAAPNQTSRDLGQSAAPLMDGVSLPAADVQYAQLMPPVDVASCSGQVMMTSSVVSAETTLLKVAHTPAATRRGRPPGRPKAVSTAVKNSPKGRGKDSNTSMAVLTLSGAAGDGSGVEAAGRGISSLGRGVLTLSKGGTSTVRVYSASGQKLSTAANAQTFSSSASHSGVPKSRGFYLTNITTTTATTHVGAVKFSDKPSTSGASPVAGRIATNTSGEDALRRMNLSVTPGATSSGQLSLNLQGISASRAVPFCTVRPTAVMVVTAPSSPTTITGISSTSTVTTISSGRFKTTKSVTGFKTSDEVTGRESLEHLLAEVNISREENDDIVDVETVPKFEFPIEIRSHETEDTFPEKTPPTISSTSEYAKEIEKQKTYTSVAVDPEISPLTTKSRGGDETCLETMKSGLLLNMQTLASGTKVVSGPKNPPLKPNLTFISSKALNKAFPSDVLPLHSLQTKSLLKNSNNTFLKVPSKTSPIRLVRSVGVTTSSAGALKATKSNATSVGNIVTKTFTISNARRTSTGKRRLSLGSGTKNVTKRSRGTSTDEIDEKMKTETDSSVTTALSSSSHVPPAASSSLVKEDAQTLPSKTSVEVQGSAIRNEIRKGSSHMTADEPIKISARDAVHQIMKSENKVTFNYETLMSSQNDTMSSSDDNDVPLKSSLQTTRCVCSAKSTSPVRKLSPSSGNGTEKRLSPLSSSFDSEQTISEDKPDASFQDEAAAIPFKDDRCLVSEGKSTTNSTDTLREPSLHSFKQETTVSAAPSKLKLMKPCTTLGSENSLISGPVKSGVAAVKLEKAKIYSEFKQFPAFAKELKPQTLAQGNAIASKFVDVNSQTLPNVETKTGSDTPDVEKNEPTKACHFSVPTSSEEKIPRSKNKTSRLADITKPGSSFSSNKTKESSEFEVDTKQIVSKGSCELSLSMSIYQQSPMKTEIKQWLLHDRSNDSLQLLKSTQESSSNSEDLLSKSNSKDLLSKNLLPKTGSESTSLKSASQELLSTSDSIDAAVSKSNSKNYVLSKSGCKESPSKADCNDWTLSKRYSRKLFKSDSEGSSSKCDSKSSLASDSDPKTPSLGKKNSSSPVSDIQQTSAKIDSKNSSSSSKEPLLKDSLPLTSETKEPSSAPQRLRRDSLTLLKTSLPESALQSLLPSKPSSRRQDNAQSAVNRITRSVAKETDPKRRLRSSF